MPVYFIQQGQDGPVKIGYSADPWKRLDQLKTGSHKELHLIATRTEGSEEADRSLEKALHQEFRECRLHGEWFKPCGFIFLASMSIHAKESRHDEVSNPCSGTDQSRSRPYRTTNSGYISETIVRLAKSEPNGFVPHSKLQGAVKKRMSAKELKRTLKVLFADGCIQALKGRKPRRGPTPMFYAASPDLVVELDSDVEISNRAARSSLNRDEGLVLVETDDGLVWLDAEAA